VTEDAADPAARLRDLEKENRVLARKLARMDSNVRQMEAMQDSTSVLLTRLTRELEEEKARSQSLLLNVLPQRIVDRLESGETQIADRLPEVTVLFGDIVGFTETSSNLEPHVLVAELNALFSRFDALCEEAGVEKIKTIGDAYMVAAGIPLERADHAEAIADMALAMGPQLARCAAEAGEALDVRIGIDSGPVVAGVIGQSKFSYDLWGDVVNTASRMESHAEPGTIQVTERAYARLRPNFELVPRGTIEVKGKGPMKSYLLTGRAPKSAASAPRS
jgi:adenylate cyclase